MTSPLHPGLADALASAAAFTSAHGHGPEVVTAVLDAIRRRAAQLPADAGFRPYTGRNRGGPEVGVVATTADGEERTFMLTL